MARGRMLNKSVSGSIKFHNLPDDTCRLLATWIIANLDIRGVFYGDPMMVRSIVFPRRADMTEAQIEGYLVAMQEQRLLVPFQAKGDNWQYWPGFLGEQVGIRPDRETTSFPPPPDDLVEDPWNYPGKISSNHPATIRQSSGNHPAQSKVKQSKSREVKLREEQNPPQFFPELFGTSIAEVKALQFTRSQWEDILRAETDARGRKTLIAWIQSKLHGGGHPAVRAYQEEMEHYPHKNQFGAIIETIGETGDLALWGRVVRDWKLYGWNQYNIAGMLDAYREGGIKKRTGTQGRKPIGMDAFDEVERAMSWGQPQDTDEKVIDVEVTDVEVTVADES